MKQTSGRTKKAPAGAVLKDIRRATRRRFGAEEKIRIVLEGLRGEDGIAELGRREGISSSMYYGGSKEFLEVGQEEARGRHRPGGDLGRGQGPASRGQCAEGGRGRPHPREPAAQKKHERGWGRRRMRYPASDKAEIIRLVGQSHLPVRRTLEKLGIPRATFYRWVELYQTGGPEALEDRRSRPSRVWNRIPDEIRAKVIALALEQPELSPRELAVRFTDAQRYPRHGHSNLWRSQGSISEASVYRLLKAHDLITSPAYILVKAADEFTDKADQASVRGTDAPPSAPNQLWQTDFTYLKVTGWGWYCLSTVLDDFSRFVVAWKLCSTMKAEDVTDTLDLALSASGLDRVKVRHRPRLLSDNGSSYIAGDLANWLEDQGMTHIRGAPRHPQTQGRIERWHQTLKNRILLQHDYLPSALEEQVGRFVEHYNHARAHESLSNLTPADVYCGRGKAILAERDRIKKQTLTHRRLQPHAATA
jgi:putative transposase